MHVHHFGPAKPSTNGAPQVVAAGFFALVFFTLLFPIVRVSAYGEMNTRVLLQMLHTNAGFNLFALLLLLIPPIGIAVAMLARYSWRVASALVAVAAVVLIPLTLGWFGHEMHNMAGNTVQTAPGVASYILLLGYLILAITTGVAAFRAR